MPRYLPHGIENRDLNRYLYTHVHYSQQPNAESHPCDQEQMTGYTKLGQYLKQNGVQAHQKNEARIHAMALMNRENI